VTTPRLITGSLPALERALAREVAVAQQSDPLAPVTVLVGGTLLRPYLRRRLAELTGGHLGVAFVTPGELGLALGERALIAAGRRPLGPLGERVLGELLAAEAEGYFGPVAGTPGFAAALARLFRELRQAGLDADAVSAVLRRSSLAKHRDLARLHARWEQRRRDFYGAEDGVACADPARLDAVRLLVYGLWQPPAGLKRLLTAVAGVRPVVVFVPTLGPAADGALDDTRGWLAGLGGVVEDAAPAEPGAPNALSRLGRSLGRPDGAAPLDGSVRLLSAPDPGREARAAVRACLRWAREGIPFYDMAVVYRQADPYRHLLDAVLRETGVPFYLHEGTPLAERPIGRRALALLELVDGGLERSAVMRFLADARLPDATWRRYGGAPAARWDVISRRAGVVRGRRQWDERLARHRAAEAGRAAEAEGDDARERGAERLRSVDGLAAFVADLDARLAARPDRARWSVHLRWLRGLFETYLDEPEPLLAALEEVEALDGAAGELPFERFRAVAADTIAGLRSADVLDARPGAFARRGVAVLDASSARGLRFRAVALVGVSDRSFPATPRQDPLLLDEERRGLNERHGWELPLRAGGPDREPLAFALAVAAAEERLLISYARSDGDDGRPQYPSVFFREAASSLTGAPVTVEAVAGLDPQLYEHLPAGRLGAGDPEEALTPVEYDRTLLEGDAALGGAVLRARVPSVARALDARDARFENPRFTAFDGVLGPGAREALGARAGLDGSLSPTSLETYATCPYQFFLSRVVGLEEQEEPEDIDRLEPRERGTLIHRALERFLAEVGDGDPPREERRAPHLARLEQIAVEECDRREALGLTGHPMLWRADRQTILEDLQAWYEGELSDPANEGFDRGAFELRFGPPRRGEQTSELSVDAPAELPLEGDALRFHGRADRVNWRKTPPRFRVIDYKTGRPEDRHKPEKLAGGRALQLPIYLLGAAHALGLPPEAGEAQYYYASARAGFKRVGFSGSTLRERRTELEELLSGMVSAIRAGDFHAEPGPQCRFCTFEPHCPAEKAAIREAKGADPLAEAFEARAEVE